MKYRLEIDCDNAAFGDGDSSSLAYEVARILKRTADQLGISGGELSGQYPVRDSNGNTVGVAGFTLEAA